MVAKAPGVSEGEATEATAPKTAKTVVAAVGVSASSEATMAEAGAPETTKAVVVAARPYVQEAEMKAAEALVAPLLQGSPLLRESARETEVYPISSDDTSQALGPRAGATRALRVGSPAGTVAEPGRP